MVHRAAARTVAEMIQFMGRLPPRRMSGTRPSVGEFHGGDGEAQAGVGLGVPLAHHCRTALPIAPGCQEIRQFCLCGACPISPQALHGADNFAFGAARYGRRLAESDVGRDWLHGRMAWRRAGAGLWQGRGKIRHTRY